ncbi:MAG: WbqC family protein [Deltaproteobacteria bacterium]|nr:WbqC family protein [Deltaproteobacteria bacterium]
MALKKKKKVAIVQSSYIPWKGYFDLINLVDEFILYDDVQFTRRDWRNRNKIKTPQGPVWLTIPVKVKGRYHQKIKDTAVADPSWPVRHWQSLAHSYARAAHFKEAGPWLKELYLACRETRMSLINYWFIKAICGFLGIQTELSWSMDYQARGARTERLVNLCRRSGATDYLSGPRAKAYLDEGLFQEAGIEVTYMDYQGYPKYGQVHPPFEHAVSVVDLILNQGPEAPRYMKSFGPRPA